MPKNKPANDEQAKAAKSKKQVEPNELQQQPVTVASRQSPITAPPGSDGSGNGILSRQPSSIMRPQTSSVMSRQPSSLLSHQPSGFLQRSTSESEGKVDGSYPQIKTGGRNFAQFAATPPPLAQRPIIQAKLMVGPVGDKYEQEADRVARQVIRGLAKPRPAVQWSPELGGDDLQAKPNHGMEGGEVDSGVARAIGSAKGGGSPIEDNVRSSMEGAFGADFGGVRVHTDTQADTLNRSLNARAFTTGSDIFFRSGEYNPGSSGGKELLAHELTHTVQQGAAGVQRQSAPLEHGHDCACGHCSVQRATADIAQAPGVLQRSASHEAGCGCPSCASVQRRTDVRIQHHSEEGRTQPTTPVIQQAMRSPLVQRHSSWEHQVLGDVPPDQVAKIGAWQDLIKQTELVGTYGWRKPKNQEATISIDGIGTIKKGTIMHVIAQEMQRLSAWQKNPPTGTSTQDKEKLYSNENPEKDPMWQVQLVALPAPEGEQPLIITYGEMNTLADFYGDLETMRSADPEMRRQIVQSVRQETFFQFKDIYTKLQNSLTDTEKKDKDVQGAQQMMSQNELYNQIFGFKFKGAISLTDYISDKRGQGELLTGAQSTGAKGEANSYGASLGRNACHFVPESWHAWARYHAQARTHADIAFDRRTKAERIEQDIQQENIGQDDPGKLAELVDRYHKEADEAANEALLNNGFGDHYLQDSYASGHMLNKTQIMQWYVQYLDETDEMKYFTDKNWRRVQQMAYRQPGLAEMIMYDKTRVRGGSNPEEELQARNPQGVEDIESDDWKDRFDALGLTIPPSLRYSGSLERELVEWWQERAMQPNSNLITGTNLLAEGPIQNQNLLEDVMKDLLQDGVVLLDTQSSRYRGGMMREGKEINFRDNFLTFSFALRDEYIPRDAQRFQEARQSSQNGDDTQYQRMAASVTYGDYFEFMNSSFLQKSTNALHDTFCQAGLTVLSGDGQHAFKVYGDDAMFNEGSAQGVKDSATTANMSRDAILKIIQTGNDNGNTTQRILGRLPDTVRVDVKDDSGRVTGTADTEISKWHNPDQGQSLRSFCFKEVFPSMSWSLMQKLGPGVMSTLGHISRDLNVHGQEAF